MFKDVVAISFYILNERYCFAFLFCVLWNTSIGREPTWDAQAVRKKSHFISLLNGSVFCWTQWSNFDFHKLKVNYLLSNLISDRQKAYYEITVSISGGQNRWKTFKFRVSKYVPHHTFNWINQPDPSVFQVYYLSFKYSSTCFGHPHAHHQVINNCSSSL